MIRQYTHKMIIAFTGHRDKTISPDILIKLANNYTDATWVHGGAKGFDSQVSEFAKLHRITEIIIKPDYTHFGKHAPLLRNKTIVDLGELLIACYDNRQHGGTKYTIDYAHKQNKEVIIHNPDVIHFTTLPPI